MQEGRGYLEPTKDLETQQQPQAPPHSIPPHSPGRIYPPSSFRRGSYSGSLATPEYVAYAPNAGAMSSYTVGHPQNQGQAQRGHGTLYDAYPSRQFAPNDSLYSPAPAAAYYRGFPHSRTPTASAPSYAPYHATSFHYLPNNRSVVPDRLYSNHTALSLPGEPITGNSYNPAATNMVNLSLDNRRTSLSTPVHMNVNNNVRHLNTPQIPLSSIPMSNGSPPESPSFTTTASTHSTWSSPYPSSISTNLGDEVGSGGQVAYPPAPAVLPHSHSAPGNLQQYGLQDQTGATMHSGHPGIPHISSDPTSISSMQEKFQSKGTSSRPRDPVTSACPPSAKKKKKSKMHACTVCRKEFPRPSGLSTHMNTHTKKRPFPCTYGCGSYFGVRSNAKRHLRTHGIPTRTSNSVAGPSTVQNQSGENSGDHPYVVGFSEPLVGGNPSSSSSGILEDDERGLEGDSTTRGPKRRKKRVGANGKSQSSPPFRRLRWMPLNLTSRTNVSDVKNLVENETNEYKEDEGEQELEEEVPRTTKEEFSD